MKYFCLGNPIFLLKMHYSNNFFENLPVLGTPFLGKLPVTQERMKQAFEASTNLVLCKNLLDANTLRHTLINKIVGAGGYPLSDYPIFEIEVDDTTSLNFINLANASDIQRLGILLSVPLHLQATFLVKDNSDLPDIEICPILKSEINPVLTKPHYLSLTDGTEEITESSWCNLL